MIFIIIPTYNEGENIEKLIKKIFNLGIQNLNVAIVDDNSSDGTGKKADELAKNFPVKVIHRPQKSGLGSAYKEGFKYALENGADLIFEMDADFSHSPQEIPNFIKTIKEGHDVVIGSRRIKGGKIIGWNIFRKFSSWGAMTISRVILNLKIYDVTSGFRCYKRKVLESIDLDKINSNGYAFQEEMIYLCEKKGFKIKEIPIIFFDRKFGKSKLSKKEIVEFFINLSKLKRGKVQDKSYPQAKF